MAKTPFPKPFNEEYRLQALRDLSLLDSEPDPEFDRITWLARRHFNTKFAVFSLVDDDRQWFKSACGLDASETPREVAFCAHTIMAKEVMIVPDASVDRRFADNPLVTDAPHIRFYAGAPIVVGGAAIGTLCVIDDAVRDTFDAEDREALCAFARIIEDELRLRENLRRTAEKFEDKYRDAENLAQAGEIAKAQFLALMSHELRTPLNAVIGFAECISDERMGPIGSEQYKEFARNIALSGRRQLNLVERLLTLSNTGTIEVDEQTIDFNALVSRCVDVLAGETLIAGIYVDTKLPHVPVSITGDPFHIEQIVLELIGNAIKFTPKDGRVEIRLLLDPNGSAVFEVIDSGQGIDNSTLDEALAIFGRISVDDSRTYDGAGLGLPLVKKLADLHGADLTLTAMPGGGTRAQICFPPYRTILAHSA